MIAQRAGRSEEALEHLDRAVAGDSKNPDGHYARAVACRSLGRIEEAEGSFREAIRVRRDYAEALHELGTILTLSSRGDEAESYLSPAVAGIDRPIRRLMSGDDRTDSPEPVRSRRQDRLTSTFSSRSRRARELEVTG